MGRMRKVFERAVWPTFRVEIEDKAKVAAWCKEKDISLAELARKWVEAIAGKQESIKWCIAVLKTVSGEPVEWVSEVKDEVL